MSDHDILLADRLVAESTPRLPTEILHLVLEAYNSSRLKELEYDRRQESKERIPAWPVLPILLSCKLLSRIFLPKLYSHTVILRHVTLFSFLNNPAYESYGHMRCLEVRNTHPIPYPHIGILENDEMDFSHFRNVSPTILSKDCKPKAWRWLELQPKYRFQRPDWADGHLPRVEVVKLDAEERRYIKLVLALFDVRHLTYMGFAVHEDESIAMPLDLCKTTTLVCPPDSWFYLTKRWETTPMIRDPESGRRRPFWTVNRPFVPYHERRYNVTILLGLKGVPLFECSTLMDHERGRAAFCLSYIIRKFCRSTETPFDFTVGPFLGRAESMPKDHRWCFGSRVPDDIEEGGYTVRFRSEFWDGASEELLYEIKRRDQVSDYGN